MDRESSWIVLLFQLHAKDFFKTLDHDIAMEVHCAGGVGGTGTVLACLYGKVNEISGEETIRVTRGIRTGSIDSVSQEKFSKRSSNPFVIGC